MLLWLYIVSFRLKVIQMIFADNSASAYHSSYGTLTWSYTMKKSFPVRILKRFFVRSYGAIHLCCFCIWWKTFIIAGSCLPCFLSKCRLHCTLKKYIFGVGSLWHTSQNGRIVNSCCSDITSKRFAFVEWINAMLLSFHSALFVLKVRMFLAFVNVFILSQLIGFVHVWFTL